MEYRNSDLSFVPIELEQVLGHTIIKLVNALNQFFSDL